MSDETEEYIDESPCNNCGEPWCDICAYRHEQAVAANPCPACKGSGLKLTESTAPTELITRARELCEVATPGPWELDLDTVYYGIGDEARLGPVLYTTPGMNDACEEDMQLMSVARTLVPELADALESTYRRLAIHEGGLRDDTLRALNRQPELIRERDEARAECERLRKEK